MNVRRANGLLTRNAFRMRKDAFPIHLHTTGFVCTSGPLSTLSDEVSAHERDARAVMGHALSTLSDGVSHMNEMQEP
jgi:hypothetical protein